MSVSLWTKTNDAVRWVSLTKLCLVIVCSELLFANADDPAVPVPEAPEPVSGIPGKGSVFQRSRRKMSATQTHIIAGSAIMALCVCLALWGQRTVCVQSRMKVGNSGKHALCKTLTLVCADSGLSTACWHPKKRQNAIVHLKRDKSKTTNWKQDIRLFMWALVLIVTTYTTLIP